MSLKNVNNHKNDYFVKPELSLNNGWRGCENILGIISKPTRG